MSKTILCYGDSNTYGYNPEDGMRYEKDVRWTGRLQMLLGKNYTIIEEGCNGRTSTYTDPQEAWKNGYTYLKPCLNTHKPIDMIIVMLGSNDLKAEFHASMAEIAEGMERIVQDMRTFLEEKQGYRPEILLISPPKITPGVSQGAFRESFDETAVEQSEQFADYYKGIAQRNGCMFLDAGEFAVPSELDHLHLSPAAHELLADKIIELIRAERESYVAPSADVMGDTVLKRDCSIWYQAVVRADHDKITIGEGTNIQDACILHADEGYPVYVGDYVTVGHGAILHGCEIGDYSLVGMGAIILNGAKIGRNCIIAAGALVPQGMEIPDNQVVMGNPAQIKREVTEEEILANKRNTMDYIQNAREHFAKKEKEIGPEILMKFKKAVTNLKYYLVDRKKDAENFFDNVKQTERTPVGQRVDTMVIPMEERKKEKKEKAEAKVEVTEPVKEEPKPEVVEPAKEEPKSEE